MWRYLKYASLGGLVAGRWRCATSGSIDMQEFRRAVKVKPRLGDILRPTEGGEVPEEEEKQRLLKTGDFLTAEKLVLAGRDELQVISKTIYNKVKLAKRGIAEVELMDVYDMMDVKVQKRIIRTSFIKNIRQATTRKSPLSASPISACREKSRKESGIGNTRGNRKVEIYRDGHFSANEVRELDKSTSASIQERITADSKNCRAPNNIFNHRASQ